MKFLDFKMAATAIFKFAILVITHRPIVRFRRNFVCGSRTSCRQRPHDKNCKFSKSNMADVKLPYPILILIVVRTYPRRCVCPCVAAKREAALRAKARGLPRATRRSRVMSRHVAAAKPRAAKPRVI